MNKEQVLAVLGAGISNATKAISHAYAAQDIGSLNALSDELDKLEDARAAIVALYEENERLRDEVGCLRDEVDQLEGQVQETQERME